jgi:hypothetical protein
MGVDKVDDREGIDGAGICGGAFVTNRVEVVAGIVIEGMVVGVVDPGFLCFLEGQIPP